MKTKLCIWLSLSAFLACVALAVVNAALRNAEAAIYLAAAAGFFAFLAAVFTADISDRCGSGASQTQKGNKQ